MNTATVIAVLLWGFAAASGLLVGAALGNYARLSKRVIAGVTAFGSGILISAIAFDLMEEAFDHAGLALSSLGLLIGAALFTGGTLFLSRLGGHHRGRTGRGNSPDRIGLPIALGTFIDAIPESIIIGMSVTQGATAALPFVAAVFVANIPEALSSTADLKADGQPPAYSFALWAAIVLASGLFALAGFSLAGLPAEWVAIIQAIGGGALLALIADSMIPQAFKDAHDWTGFIATFGFLCGFALSHGFG